MTSLVAGVLLLMTTACTSSVGGSAEAGSGSSVSSAQAPSVSPSSEPSGTGSSGSSQPGASAGSTSSTESQSTETLDAAGIDPCKVLPDDVQATLGITSSAPPDAAAFNGATCLYSAGNDVTYALTVTDGQTLDQLKASVSGRDTTESQIEGFPALTTYDKSKATVCTTAIGVSDTGMFVVSILDPKAVAADRDKLCGMAKSAATTGLKGLRAQQ
ncbi:hypothetical protein ABIB25_003884 [Nakamurella sp. UYEF19]|uniref:DUF3558 domain-containing protein n=1 Tax=Nakamurella sp. UYEF19 TaxID=1756392 RepID=UPI0033972FBE